MKACLIFFYTLVLAGFLNGCNGAKGRDDPEPAPTTGTIQGTVLPAAGVSQVFIISGSDTLSIEPSADGTFQVKEATPGTYQVAVKANANYVAPPASDLTVSAGKVITIPEITLYPIGPQGLFVVTLDGVTYAGTPYAHAIRIGGSQNIWLALVLKNNQTIGIDLPTITGPATFTTLNSTLHFSPDYVGSLTVTAYNQATKTGDATFSFPVTAPGVPDKPLKGALYNVRMMQ